MGKTIIICPRCKSEDVKLELGNLYGAPGNWICNKCGFHNVVFPIKEKIKENLK